MLQIGKTQELTLARTTSVGSYLTDGQEDVLLPKKYIPPGADVGQSLRVFVYLDSEDRPVATTQRPKAEEGSFAVLKCIEVSQVGAFLDWGLDKDLLVPFREQVGPMNAGHSYVVRIVFDEVSKRLIGSCRLRRYLIPPPPNLRSGETISFLVTEIRPRMVRGVADGKYLATLLEDEMGPSMRVGQTRQAWIKGVGEEGVLVALRPLGRVAESAEATALLERLNKEGGFMNLTDDSPPEAIRKALGISKSSFKRIIGQLYKQGKIELDPYGIRLVS